MMLERVLDDIQEFIEMLETDMEFLKSSEARQFNSNIINDLKDLKNKYAKEDNQ